MTKKKKTILACIACILIASMLGVSIWLITVDSTSRKYNLVTLDTSDVPAPISAYDEADIQLSEITMHYAVRGSGKPLILLHGNGNSNESLRSAAEYLANDYTVYALDSRCHGKSTATDEISYDKMADDVAEFIAKMDLDKPYLIGHSDGGITAIDIAMRYPELLGGFIACGANSVPEAFKPYFTAAVKISYKKSKSILDAMMLEQPHFTEEQLSKIKTPAYIVAGEFDIVKLKDTAFLADSIPNSKVSIIKWGDHSSYIKNDGKQAYSLARSFFSDFQ